MKKIHVGGGSHGAAWVVTFADLVSLLMAFFVMLLSFSVQDQQKLAEASGSIRDAFGIAEARNKAGAIERDGNPQRDFLRDLGQTRTDGSTEFASQSHLNAAAQGQEANTYSQERTDIERAAQFALAAASVKQSFQDLPDITSVADNIIVAPSRDGLDITIADQTGKAMFPDGSKYPFELTRKAVIAMAPLLQKLPNQIRITGHTGAGAHYDNPHYGQWELSFDRADVIRQILEAAGVSPDRIQEVSGRGDADPFFPGDPYLAANQRVTLTVVFEKPPVPVSLSP